MPVRKMSPTVILDLAQTYHVDVLITDRVPSHVRGPRGHGADTKKRILYIQRDGDWEVEGGIEGPLHELAHIITQPPWEDISETAEDFILLQFERVLAEAFFDKKAVEQVIEWQEMTESTYLKQELCMASGYKRMDFWQNGYRACQLIGLLDRDRKLFNPRPNWRRFSKRLREATKKYFHNGGPLPVYP